MSKKTNAKSTSLKNQDLCLAKESPLGKSTVYTETYSPELLFPISRNLARSKIRLSTPLPFNGVDLWNGYEFSWLSPKGKPEIGLVTFSFPYDSPNIVESKSFKLYLNSFTQSRFGSLEEVQALLKSDLSKAAEAPVEVTLQAHSQFKERRLGEFFGICLDQLDIEVNQYEVNPKLLKTLPEKSTEVLYSNLLKSNCLATGQPDWGSVLIHYTGKKIDHSSLLKYIVSYRSHSGFAEYCVEQMFHDILIFCSPEKLTVHARYTRRGGLDINPFRSNFEQLSSNVRHLRQ